MIKNRNKNGTISITRPNKEELRYCPDCDNYLEKSDFYKDNRGYEGLTRKCKKHHSAKSYESRKKKLNHSYWKVSERKYGIDKIAYDKMLEAQNGLCKICQQPNFMQQRLVIDHDHNTGKVRGLLCGHCNSGLGWFRDNVGFLVAAQIYLSEGA